MSEGCRSQKKVKLELDLVTTAKCESAKEKTFEEKSPAAKKVAERCKECGNGASKDCYLCMCSRCSGRVCTDCQVDNDASDDFPPTNSFFVNSRILMGCTDPLEGPPVSSRFGSELPHSC